MSEKELTNEKKKKKDPTKPSRKHRDDDEAKISKTSKSKSKLKDSDEKHQSEKTAHKQRTKDQTGSSTSQALGSLLNTDIPNSDIDEILAVNQKQFLVKKKDVPYHKSTWMDAQDIEKCIKGKAVYDIFTSMQLRDKAPYYNSVFARPEYIIGNSKETCYVKWKGLGYQHATEEHSHKYMKKIMKKRDEVTHVKEKPSWFFNLNEMFQEPVNELVVCYEREMKCSDQVRKEYSLVGGCGTTMRMQVYSLIAHLWKNITNLPILLAVEQRVIQVVEAELRYTLKPRVLIIPADDVEINGIKEKCFDNFSYDLILIAIEALGKFNKEFKNINFSLAVIDMTEFFGREFSSKSSKSFFGSSKASAVMKLALTPQFIKGEYIIDSRVYPTLEEFSWMIQIHPDGLPQYEKIIDDNAPIIFDKKTQNELSAAYKALREIIDFQGIENFKTWCREISETFEQTNRKRLLSKITKSIASINSKLHSIIILIKHCIDEDKRLLIFTRNVEIITLLSKFIEACRVQTITIPSFSRCTEEISILLSNAGDKSGIVIASPEEGIVDLKDFDFNYAAIYDPEYSPQFTASGERKTTIIRMITQSSCEIPLAGSIIPLNIVELNKYSSRFYWRPKREKREPDYSSKDFLEFEHDHKIFFQSEPGSIAEDYEIHSKQTDFLIKVLDTPENVETIPIVPANVYEDDIKCIIDNLSLYCWGQWSKICDNSSESYTKTESIAITKYLLSKNIISLPLLSNFMDNETLPISQQTFIAIGDIVSKHVKADRDIRVKLKRIEKLLLISFVVLNASKAPDSISIPWIDLYKPAPWWKESDDRLLLWRTWLHGYSKINNMDMYKWSIEERVDEEDLTKRLRILTAMIRKNIESYTISLTLKPMQLEHEKRPAKIWSSKEQKPIISQLIDFGAIDSKQLATIPQLSKRNPQEIEEFADQIIRASLSTIVDPAVFCSRKILDLIRNTRELFELAKTSDAENMFEEDRIIIETVKTYGLSKAGDAPCFEVHPSKPTKANIRELFERVLRVAEMPTGEEKEAHSVEIPITAGRNILVTKLGKISTKPDFSDNNYIYPIGLTTTISFCDNPASCEIMECNDKPLFVIHNEKQNKEHDGQTPTIAMQKFIQSVIPSQSIFYKNVTGYEFFGLCCVDVLYAIQQLPDADKCPNYRMKFFRGKSRSLRMQSAVSHISQFSTLRFKGTPGPIQPMPNTEQKLVIEKAKVTHKKKGRITLDIKLPASSLMNVLNSIGEDDEIMPSPHFPK